MDKFRISHRPTLAQFIGQVLPVLEGAMAASDEKLSPIDVLHMAINIERGFINRSNAELGAGAPVSKDWQRRLGMDPMDALMLRKLLSNLGQGMKPARLIRLVADHAIAKDDAAPGADALRAPLRADLRLEKRIKSFFEKPPAQLLKTHEEQISNISQDHGALVAELRALELRIMADLPGSAI